jgi:hypothetical protein
MTNTTLNRTIINKLNQIYYQLNSSAAYSGIDKVYKEAKKYFPKLKLNDVIYYLQGQSTYTLYRPSRKRYKRLATVPSGLHTDWQCDLAIFDSLRKNNDGYKYLLVCIDVLSRKIFVSPAQSKSSQHMKKAFDKIFLSSKIKPHKLYSDRGLEFQAKEMLKYFENNDIIKQVVYSPNIHAGIVERANRTIKDRLYRYFYKNKTHRWIEAVYKIVEGINNSVNRSTGLAPNKFTYKNAQKIYDRLYKAAFTPSKFPKYKVGDIVRINKDKGIFGKGYHPNYTKELFKIKTVKKSNPPHYKLADLKEEDILGVFYEPELSFVQTSIGDQNMKGNGKKIIPQLWQKSI